MFKLLCNTFSKKIVPLFGLFSFLRNWPFCNCLWPNLASFIILDLATLLCEWVLVKKKTFSGFPYSHLQSILSQLKIRFCVQERKKCVKSLKAMSVQRGKERGGGHDTLTGNIRLIYHFFAKKCIFSVFFQRKIIIDLLLPPAPLENVSYPWK